MEKGRLKLWKIRHLKQLKLFHQKWRVLKPWGARFPLRWEKQIRNRSKWAETEARKPWQKLQQNPEKLQKNSRKKHRSQVLTFFPVQVTEKGLKSATWSPGHIFWAEKCDLQLRLSRRQICGKVAVSVAADVCHLRNREIGRASCRERVSSPV